MPCDRAVFVLSLRVATGMILTIYRLQRQETGDRKVRTVTRLCDRKCVAEKSRLPLYILSAAELGTQPSTVEQRLSTVLECCKLWKAILLIDEADIFLSTRSAVNMEQNELISIFLRQLEYYEGLMFLTTNRVKSIDPAFRSRVDIILYYRDLDASARSQVWRNFIMHVGSHRFDISDQDIDKLAEIPANGREIKSLVKSALRMESKINARMLEELATMRSEAEKVFLEP